MIYHTIAKVPTTTCDDQLGWLLKRRPRSRAIYLLRAEKKTNDIVGSLWRLQLLAAKLRHNVIMDHVIVSLLFAEQTASQRSSSPFHAAHIGNKMLRMPTNAVVHTREHGGNSIRPQNVYGTRYDMNAPML